MGAYSGFPALLSCAHRSESKSVIGLIILGLAFLFFVVVAFFSARNWHAGHVVASVFLFLFTLLFLYMSAALMRTYDKYRPAYDRAIADTESLLDRNQALTFGNASELAGEGTMVGERTLIREEGVSDGRRWGNVRVARPGVPIVLDMSRWSNDGCERVGQEDEDQVPEPVPDEELAGDGEGGEGEVAAPAGDSHGIVSGQVLYAFKEFPVAQLTPAEKEYYFAGLGEGEDAFPNLDKRGLCRVPVSYLGKFVVEATDERSVTVVAAGVLTDGQKRQLANPNPWVLYEKLPTDTHAMFAGIDAARLPALLPIQRLVAGGLQISPQAYERMLNEYARDGREFTGQVANPMRVNVEVKFLKDHTQVVDLEVEGELPPADSPFDVQGRAQVPSLLQGEPTKFAKDDIATFDSRTANGLARQGIVEPNGNPTYSRRLNDFEYSLNQHQSNLRDIDAELKLVTSQVAALTASLERLQMQIDKHRDELVKLEADRQGFDTESKELEAYRDMLRARVSVLQGEVDYLASTGGG